MPSNSYWQRRAAQRMYRYQADADKIADDIAKAYIKSTNYINAQIEKVFRNFQFKNGLTEDEAKRLLKELPDNATLDDLKKSVSRITDEEVKKELISIIDSPAYAHRIGRFEQVQAEIDKHTASLADFEQNVTKKHYTSLAKDAFLQSIFEIQKGTGIAFSFANIPKSRVELLLKSKWSGKNFSERIWDRSKDINQVLREELLCGFLTGRGYNKTAKEVERRMASGSMEARRLVRTESAYIEEAAELESYKECGIEKLRFFATLDMRTSEICAAHDGEIIEVDKAVPGINIPPLHPCCRSTTIAVFDEDIVSRLKRRAKDPETGEDMLVPADMTYKGWKNDIDKRYGNGYVDIKRKMFKNEKSDREQYKKYLLRLGKENVPESFDLFQELKYKDTDMWADVQYYYRYINGRPIEYVKIDRELSKLGIVNKGRAFPAEDIHITGWRSHALKRLSERDITENQALEYKSNAIGMMKKYPNPNTQNNYYSVEGLLGIRVSDGLVCTVYSKEEFGKETEKILEAFKKWIK